MAANGRWLTGCSSAKAPTHPPTHPGLPAPLQEATDFMHAPPTAEERGEARRKEEGIAALASPAFSNGPSGWGGSQASAARGRQQCRSGRSALKLALSPVS
jgi:hypothetical protein